MTLARIKQCQEKYLDSPIVVRDIRKLTLIDQCKN